MATVHELPARREPGALADGYRPTDVGNASRLADLSGTRLRFVRTWGKWLVYTGGVWRLDSSEALVTEYAKGVPREMFLHAATLEPERREAMWKWAKASESASKLAAMVRLARGLPQLLVDHDELDAHPYLLNVANGTVDLLTGDLLDHDPNHLLTMQAPVPYDPDAVAPLWRSCLERWQPDREVRSFLQRVIGSGATGRPVQHLVINVGEGGNGKGRCFAAVRHVLGPYVVVPHKSLFVTTRHDPHDTVKAALFGARLLLAPETERGDRLAEAQVKELTGADAISARRMHEDPWEFQPTWTATLHTNHKPHVRGTDEGVWRRIRIVEWNTIIPDAEKDAELDEKLRKEAPGILSWIVDGALTYLTAGLCEPASVVAASTAYRSEEDHVGRWVADRCLVGPGLWVLAGDLRRDYEAWCETEGERPLSARALAPELVTRGAEKASRGTHKWLGIGLSEGDST